jgi:hypothetical protein
MTALVTTLSIKSTVPKDKFSYVKMCVSTPKKKVPSKIVKAKKSKANPMQSNHSEKNFLVSETFMLMMLLEALIVLIQVSLVLNTHSVLQDFLCKKNFNF